MPYDAHSNLAYSTVAVAPVSPTAGLTLTVATGDGAKFPATPFNATIWPANTQALASNSEIVRVTGITGDVLTIARTSETGGISRTILATDQIAATITKKTLIDIENSIAIVPQVPTAGFTVPTNTQLVFVTDIDMSAGNGDLTVNGIIQGIH